MIFTESGEVLKCCQRCGKRLLIDDYYSGMSTKYCKPCAAEVKRNQIAGYMREKRAKAAERRKLEQERCRLLEDENAVLREEIKRIKARLEASNGKA